LTKAIMNNVPEMAYQYIGFAKVQIEKIQKGDKSAIPALLEYAEWIIDNAVEIYKNQKNKPDEEMEKALSYLRYTFFKTKGRFL